jgi:hypothetical protein
MANIRQARRPRDGVGRAVSVAVPDGARARISPVPDGAYQSAFRVDICPLEPTQTAEYWIRATFEDAPRRWRWFLISGWIMITCRLRLRQSTSRVLGWEVEQTSPDTAVTVVRGWVGLTSRIVTLVEADNVTLCSFVEFSGPTAAIARVVWAMTIPLHERILPHLLTQAARREPCAH